MVTQFTRKVFPQLKFRSRRDTGLYHSALEHPNVEMRQNVQGARECNVLLVRMFQCDRTEGSRQRQRRLEGVYLGFANEGDSAGTRRSQR